MYSHNSCVFPFRVFDHNPTCSCSRGVIFSVVSVYHGFDYQMELEIMVLLWRHFSEFQFVNISLKLLEIRLLENSGVIFSHILRIMEMGRSFISTDKVTTIKDFLGAVNHLLMLLVMLDRTQYFYWYELTHTLCGSVLFFLQLWYVP